MNLYWCITTGKICLSTTVSAKGSSSIAIQKAYFEGHMMVFENANAEDFDNAVKCNILKSIIGLDESKIPTEDKASIILQSVFPISDTQKIIDEALVKQKFNYDAKIEKLRKEVQSSKAQKTQTLVSQTIEPVRQPRGLLSNLKTEKDYENYYIVKYFSDLDIYSKEDLDSNYSKKPFQRSHL
ncbi:9063_t:CDS:2 [Cetraspora pellucida]|uniref:9063_t:CDS:1 n=1 Tax=Cetraspora pellucida TaxID=1433469 RepID=A0A9N9DW31_9GLOM|nr:9063_t:CDS:2 [Cetraspora pellucida]